ncbi:MAG: DUF484 family protein [Rhodocyclales bacterium]|nr:DUF484 family protein [Rhodocyclales bacterium]
MSALFADEVAEFLKSNPGFFEQYADLMAQIFVPHPHGGRAVSLAERQMLTLREKNRATEGQLTELIANATENDEIAQKVHRLSVGLVSAESFIATIYLIGLHLRDDFGVPEVSLRLWEKPAFPGELPEFVAISPELEVFVDTMQQPYCGSTAGFGAHAWFGAAAEHLRSQVLIPLRGENGSIGLLAMGSDDPQRFYGEMGDLFLVRIGELVSAALVRVAKSST